MRWGLKTVHRADASGYWVLVKVQRPRIKAYILTPASAERPIPPFQHASIPCLNSSSELAGWLGLTDGELRWFADAGGRQLHIADGPLRHYLYYWRERRFGPPRLIEAPKARLKGIQRHVLHQLLERIPPHVDVHGFRKGHSGLSYATPHASRELVMRMDLKDFFLTIPAARVHSLFRCLGYPWSVARLLTGLCTNSVPFEVFGRLSRSDRDWSRRKVHQQPHLPQGAPSSPAIANLCAYRLDCRLAGLADSVGLMYERYADDLAFSGGDKSASFTDWFQIIVASIALEEGFVMNARKTRVMRQSVRQKLSGVVVNRYLNICRKDYDRLKAMLFNCRRYGPQTQNHSRHPDFRAHLKGHIARVESLTPDRGRRLRKVFDAIEWE